MLASALRATGLAGVPCEYFNARAFEDSQYPKNGVVQLQKYVLAVKARRTAANGIFGMKLHYRQFASIFSSKEVFESGGVDFIRSFNKFILIYRRDKILQAISNILARENYQWNSTDPTRAGSYGRPYRAIDTVQIVSEMKQMVADDFKWRILLKRLGLESIQIAYEDLVQDPISQTRRVLDYLGIGAIPEGRYEHNTVKLANPEKALRMKAEFLSAIGAKARE